MRLNKFIARATGLSRRSADELIKFGKVRVDNEQATLGQEVNNDNTVELNGTVLNLAKSHLILMLNKPAGYVCSRNGQGSKTIYDLLPEKFHNLKPVGRLDKNSSGLILLTNDGELANQLTHPRYQKQKVYQVVLNKTLELSDKKKLLTGVVLSDGLSKFIKIKDYPNNIYEVVLEEGRNRQIRRTFNALGYKLESLHRIKLGKYMLNDLSKGKYIST